MKFSWSHNLFLWVNARIGKYRLLDRIAIVCGHWLIFVMAAVALWWLWQGHTDMIIYYALSFGIAFLFSYWFALTWKHQRPVKELHNIKILIEPLGSWKAFPSDHTMVATIVTLLHVLFAAPSWLVLLFGVFTVCIAGGRVYCGVHYPRDIVGGFAVGIIAVILVRLLLV